MTKCSRSVTRTATFVIKDSAQASNLKSVTLLHKGDAIVTNAIIHTVKHQITPAKCVCVCARLQYWTVPETGRLPRGRRPLAGIHNTNQFPLRLRCLEHTKSSLYKTRGVRGHTRVLVHPQDPTVLFLFPSFNNKHCPSLSLSSSVTSPPCTCSLTSSDPLSRVDVDGGSHQIAVSLPLLPKKVQSSPGMGLW